MNIQLIVYLFLVNERKAVNKNHGSRQGSFADMSLEELQNAGQKLIEAELNKWRDDGKIVYVPKVEDGVGDNVQS